MDLVSTRSERLGLNKELAHELDLAMKALQAWKLEQGLTTSSQIDSISFTEQINFEQESSELLRTGITTFDYLGVGDEVDGEFDYSSQTFLTKGLEALQGIKYATIDGINLAGGTASIDYAVSLFSQMSMDYINQVMENIAGNPESMNFYNDMIKMYEEMIQEADKKREEFRLEQERKRMKRYAANLKFMLTIFDKTSSLYETTKVMFNAVKAMIGQLG